MSSEHLLHKRSCLKKRRISNRKIVETAIKMFADKGFANTSSEIARAFEEYKYKSSIEIY